MSLASIGVTIIQIILLIWDFLTIPIYLLIQTPWKKQAKRNRQRSRVISHQATEITFRAIPMVCNVKEELKAQSEEINTLERLFAFCVKKHGYKPCLGARAILGEEDEQQPNGKMFTKLHLGDYSWKSYIDVNTRAEQLGRGLRELGLKPRDKVVLYANTCDDWMISAIACFKHSIAIVTIYTNLGEEGVAHGICQTDAAVVIASPELVPRLAAVLHQAPSVHSVVVIPGPKPHTPPDMKAVTFYRMEDVVTNGAQSNITSVAPEPEDTAIIMYTSGSTGVPKGVVLTHRNIVQGMFCLLPTAAEAMGELGSHEAYIAYLPLAHVLELLAENVMLVLGIPVGYSTANTLLDTSTMIARGNKGDATVLQPTVMCAVPLVLDRIYKGVLSNIKKKGEFTTLLMDFCYNYRLSWNRMGYDTPIMNRLIFSKLSAVIGGRVRVLLSGGAPLAPDAHDFVRTCLNVDLLQGYGLTETSATACVTDCYDLSTGRVGAPLQEVDVRLVNWEEGGYTVTDQQGARGEIVVGGSHVAKEYYAMPDKTEEDFFTDNGKRWFRTGDIGQYCDNGTLRIIDRKKDLVKLQGGEYVSLGKVETLVKIHPLVDNICVYGDPGRIHTVALVVPDQAMLLELANKLGKSALTREQLCADPQVVGEVTRVLSQHAAKQKLAKFEIPQAFYLVSEPWTPEGGLVTAAMKLKRKSIEHAFQEAIAEMYEQADGNNNNKQQQLNGVKVA